MVGLAHWLQSGCFEGCPALRLEATAEREDSDIYQETTLSLQAHLMHWAPSQALLEILYS